VIFIDRKNKYREEEKRKVSYNGITGPEYCRGIKG
jgi:hypothetical protein